MKCFNKKSNYFISLLVVFILLVQVFLPSIEARVFANENVISNEENAADENATSEQNGNSESEVANEDSTAPEENAETQENALTEENTTCEQSGNSEEESVNEESIGIEENTASEEEKLPEEDIVPEDSNLTEDNGNLEENVGSEEEIVPQEDISNLNRSLVPLNNELLSISQELLLDTDTDTTIGSSITKEQIIKTKIDFGASGNAAFYNTKIKYTLPVGAECLEIITPAYIKAFPEANDVERDITLEVVDEQGKLEPGTTGNIYIRFRIPEAGKYSPYPNGKVIRFENNATISGYEGSIDGNLVETTALPISVTYSLPSTWRIEKTGPSNVTISKNPSQTEIILDYGIKLRGGDIDLKDVEIIDTLPDDVVIIDSDSGSVDSNTVKWAFPDVKAGTEKVMSLKVKIPIKGRGGNTTGIEVSEVKTYSRTNSVRVTGYPIDTEDDGSKDGNIIKYKDEYVFSDSEDQVTTNFKLSGAEWEVTIRHTDDNSIQKTIKLSKNDEDTDIEVGYKIKVDGGDINFENGEIRYEIPANAVVTVKDGGVENTIEGKQYIVWSGINISANESITKNITVSYSIDRGFGTGVKDGDSRENNVTLFTNNGSDLLLDSDTATTNFEDSDVKWRINKTVDRTSYTVPDDATEETGQLTYTIKVYSDGGEASHNIPLKTLTVKDTLAPGAILDKASISSNPSVTHTINENTITWTFNDVEPGTSPTMRYKVKYPIKRGTNSGNTNAVDPNDNNSRTKENIAMVTVAITKDGAYSFESGYGTDSATTIFTTPGAPRPYLNIYIEGTNKDGNGAVTNKHFDKGDEVTYSIDLNNNNHYGHSLKNVELLFDNYDEADSTLKKKLDINKIVTGTGSNNESIKYKLLYKVEGESGFTTYGNNSGEDIILNMNTSTQITPTEITNISDITELKFEFLDEIPKKFSLSNKFKVQGTIKDTVTYNTEMKNSVSLEGKYQGFKDLEVFNKVISQIELKIYLDTAWISTFGKQVQSFKSKGYNNTEEVDFVITLVNHNTLATSPLEKPTIIDVLPEGFEFISWNEDNWNTDNSSINKPTLQKIEDYPVKGQTTLIWSWSDYDLPKGRTTKIKFKTKILEHVLAGRHNNDIYLMANGSYIWKSNPPSLVDTADIDNDNNKEEKYIQGNGAYVDIIKSASTRTTKYVRGELDRKDFTYEKDGVTITGKGFQFEDENGNPIYGKSTPGGAADYSLRVKNTGNVPIKELVMVDILPFVGDTYVARTSERDSAWTPYLIEAINDGKLPIVKDVYKGEDESSSAYDKYANVKVFYSTAENPERKISGNTIGTQNPQWSETPPEDITSVKSLKFDIDFYDSGNDENVEDFLQPGSTMRIDFKMRAPIGAHISEGENKIIAWNSVSTDALSYYKDNEEPLTIVEPRKVGMTVESNPLGAIGNFVWFDKNDNGIQDDGYDDEKAGINGIKVKLYKKVSDTWELRGTTVTGNDHNGKPGYYLFPALETGEYYVEFEVPSHFKITSKRQGNDDTKDSDVYEENSVFRTRNISVITVGDASKKYNYNLDLGLINADGGSLEPPNLELTKKAIAYNKEASSTEIEFVEDNKIINVDETIIYKISVKNTGGIPLNNIRLLDTLETRGFKYKRANFADETGKKTEFLNISKDSNIIHSSEENGLRIKKLLPEESYDIYGEYEVNKVELNNKPLVNTVKIWANELKEQSGKDTPYKEASDSVNIADMQIEKRVVSIAKSDGTEIKDIDINTVGVEEGDTINYEIKVINTGSIELQNIHVIDLKVQLDEEIATEEPLLPGDFLIVSVSYKVEAKDKENGIIENIASATTPKIRDIKKSDKVITYFKGLAVTKDIVRINGEDVNTIDKIEEKYVVKHGDVIEYEVTFANNGDYDLKDVIIVEDRITSSGNNKNLSTNEKLADILKKGDQLVKSYTYTVGDNDIASDGEETECIKNTVIGKSKYTQQQERSVDVHVAHLAIDKKANKTRYYVGETVDYTITLTNKGTIPLTNVKVKDPMLNEIRRDGEVLESEIITIAEEKDGEKATEKPAEPKKEKWFIVGKLAKNASVTLTGSYKVTKEDLAKGKIENIATAVSSETEEIADASTVTVRRKSSGGSGGNGGSSGGGGGGSDKDDDKDPELKPDPDPQPEPNPDPQPEPEPEPEPQPQPDPQPDPEPGETPEEPEDTGEIVKDEDDVPTYIPPKDKEVVEIVEQPEHGTVKKDDDGNIKYIPKDGYKGPDKFKVKVKDGEGNELIIEIEIPDENIPQGTIKVLPQTGEGRHYPYYLFGLAILLLGLLMNFKGVIKRFKL